LAVWQLIATHAPQPLQPLLSGWVQLLALLLLLQGGQVQLLVLLLRAAPLQLMLRSCAPR
jgi:hypothetical protein